MIHSYHRRFFFCISLAVIFSVSSSFYVPHGLSDARTRRYLSQQAQQHHVVAQNPYDKNADLVQPEKKTIIPSSTTPPTNLNLVASSSFLLATIAVAIALIPLPAGAIDNPADYFHLDIPLPVPDYRYFVAGGLCAAASHGVTTPIDVVKTRIQADPTSYNQGFLDAALKISKEGGDGVLLSGLGPTVIGYGVEGAAKFGLYESLKPIVKEILSLDTPTIPYLIASVVAGATASVMLCPMEKARVRLVTDPDFAPNLVTAIPLMVDESGVGGLFGGLSAMLSKQVPYTFAKQVSFDTFASILYAAAANANLAAAEVKFEVSFGAALLASVLACLLSHPGDVILTGTYKGSNPRSFSTVVSQIYNDGGIQGFFSGLSARFLHVGAIITSQLVLYDIIKQALGLPATGS